MSTLTVTVTGDDEDDLKEGLEKALVMLGGSAPEVEEEEEQKPRKRRPKPTEDDDTGEDDETSEEDGEDEDLLGDTDESEELREKISAKVIVLIKKPDGADKVRAAFAKGKGKKLDQIKDKMLPIVAKALGVK